MAWATYFVERPAWQEHSKDDKDRFFGPPPLTTHNMVEYELSVLEHGLDTKVAGAEDLSVAKVERERERQGEALSITYNAGPTGLWAMLEVGAVATEPKEDSWSWGQYL